MNIKRSFQVFASLVLLFLTNISSTQVNLKPESLRTVIGLQGMKKAPLVSGTLEEGSKQNNLYQPFALKESLLRNAPLKSVLSHYVPLSLTRKNLENLLESVNTKESLHLWIPLDKEYGFEIELEPQSNISEQFLLTTSSGDTIKGTQDIKPHYSGYIKDDPNSLVSVSFYNKSVKMLLSNDLGTFNLVPIVDQEDSYLLFNDQHLKKLSYFDCGVQDEPGPYNGAAANNPLSAGVRARNRVELYLEIDYDAYVENGYNLNNTRNWALSIFRDMAAVFERHSISIRLNELFVWTTDSDPFNDIAGNFDNFDADMESWSGSRTSFNGDVAHYISTEGTNRWGLANGIGTICDKVGGVDNPSSHSCTLANFVPHTTLDGFFSGVANFDVPSWNLLSNCHELGHVFGANHTHACKWGSNGTSQIDDCGNVFAITNGFDEDGDGTIDEIDEAEGASCFFAETPILPSMGGTFMSFCHLQFNSSPQISLSKGFHAEVVTRMRNTINNSSCIGTYNTNCPVVEVIELDFSGTWDASEEVLIHDATVNAGGTLVTAGTQVIIYGNFTCPANAAFEISGTGCSNN